ncbi:hypothetical protein RAB80_016920 [Fusarium oxysporum f. sp. vasinfectum]|nr:hypothetical protein RAB80_016920 [Fusarium oxysporum f. sp. vasinfectum]
MWIRKVALGIIAFSVAWNILQSILCSLTCVPIALFCPVPPASLYQQPASVVNRGRSKHHHRLHCLCSTAAGH